MNDILSGLNSSQQKAVVLTEGRIRIVAGAGSGKTRVIAHRYAYLVNQLGIDPGNILCTTFTNKAAKEMISRISKLVVSGHYNDFVCTIHGFCVKFLREEIHHIGYPSSFTIIDEEDSKILAKEVMDELKLEVKSTSVNRFLKEKIVRSKSLLQGEYIGKYFASTDLIAKKELENPFVRYLHKQCKLFALDFQDLIYVTLFILERFADTKNKWADRMNYLMVDEAQDLCPNQWRLIEILASSYNNLFIVGDPDQAIYEWRGASPDLFVKFENDESIILNENYRSTPNILNVANSIIRNNINRIKKDLFTNKKLDTMVVHHHSLSEKEESEWVAKQIATAISKGDTRVSDFAVLFRASYLSRSIEQALIKKNIKYSIWGGIRFFERREIKDCLAYLRVIAVGDDMSLKRIVNVPSRKLGKVYLQQLKELADEKQTTYYETLKNNITDKRLNRATAKEFVAFIEECRNIMPTMNISDFANYVIENSGLKKEIRDSGDEERLDNLNELISSIKLYEDENKDNDITILSYLQDIALYTNADFKNDRDTVKLMTIHQSKGLEFPYVFIIGTSEGILPNYRALREYKEKGEEEERRLMYVAITRAEKGLFISESEGYIRAINSDKYPSRFIREIKSEWLVIEGNISEELWLGTEQMIKDNIIEEESSLFKIGDKVSHKIFGVGEVISILENKSLKVKFEKGNRVIMPSFLTKE